MGNSGAGYSLLDIFVKGVRKVEPAPSFSILSMRMIIKFLANKLIHHFFPTIDTLNKISGTNGTYISFSFNFP